MVGLMKAAFEAKKHKSALRPGVDGDRWTIKDHIKTEVSLRVPQFGEMALSKVIQKRRKN